MANLTAVDKYFITAKEGFSTTLASSITSGATTVPLTTTAGYANGDIVALTIEPASASAKQVFTGEVSGTNIINVDWTEGTNQAHAAGATVIDYTSATHQAAMAKGLLVRHNQNGTLKTFTESSVVTTASIQDSAISTAKIANDAVTLAKQAAGGMSRIGLSVKTTNNTLLTTSYATYLTVTGTTTGGEVEVDFRAFVQNAGSGSDRTYFVKVQCDGVDVAPVIDQGYLTHTATTGVKDSNHPSLIISHTPTAASHTWTLQLVASVGTAVTLHQASLKVTEIAA